MSVISGAEAGICAFGLESKELFVLAEIDEQPLSGRTGGGIVHAEGDGYRVPETFGSGGIRASRDRSRRSPAPSPAAHRDRAQSRRGGMRAVSEEFTKRLGRLTDAQQRELKNLLEKII